jgi:hypothetical protein
MAQRTRTIVALVLIALGLVWIGQGTGVLRGSSFMVGDPLWAWIGAAAVVAGGVLAWSSVTAARR